MASRSFVELRQEAARLRAELLPSTFDPTGTYSADVHTHTRAYLILCHAAFESYFEAEAKRIVKRCESIFDTTGRLTRPLAFLIASSVRRFADYEPKNKSVEQRMRVYAQALFRDLFETIRHNNGIKEASVYTLFDPLGVPESLYTTTLLAHLNTLGTDRGDHAHHSSSTVGNILDPETEFKRVTALIAEVEIFDRDLSRYGRTIR